MRILNYFLNPVVKPRDDTKSFGRTIHQTTTKYIIQISL
ncbi:MAG TPA: hypothetical protein LFW20_05000 [Rickettsia endosymbiont of Omalisus fontisbellaquei]|nr:hypothetical protein [Rickettsia endosymbiont of Omalisus fontisbellaquei]